MIKTILVVDDEPRTRTGLKKMLETWGAGQTRILTADNAKTAQDILETEPVHLLITDIRMPVVSGLNLVETLNRMRPRSRPAVILISGYAEFNYARQGIELGVANYLLKPISRDKLVAAVEQALREAERRMLAEAAEKFMDPKLLDAQDGTKPLSEPVRQAMEYVERHLDRAIGLREAAAHVHLTPSYFSTLFKEQMRMTFSEYVARRKLQKGKEWLLHTKLPVSDIADRLGYQSPKYFNKLFRKYEGCSPRQYRLAMTGEADEAEFGETEAEENGDGTTGDRRP